MLFELSHKKQVGITSAIIFLFLLFSCKHSYQKRIIDKPNDNVSNFFINANKKIIQNEEQSIDSLLGFSNIPFIKDSTGIRIFIDYSDLNTDISNYPKEANLVTARYNCVVFDDVNTLLDNRLIDTISFKIGYSKQMRGLNYAIKLLQIGDKAKIIIPSYLAFGMSGYGKTVPPYSTLLLNVELLNIK